MGLLGFLKDFCWKTNILPFMLNMVCPSALVYHNVIRICFKVLLIKSWCSLQKHFL